MCTFPILQFVLSMGTMCVPRPFITVLLIAAFLHPLEFPFAECKNRGFTIDLLRRDSVNSPSNASSISHFERLSKAFDRSISRAAYFKQVRSGQPPSSTIDSPLTSILGEYVMKLSIGTPPVEITAIADTGSDVTWTQCKPCTKCYVQKDPLFDASKTSSYRRLSCHSSQCQAVGTSSCDNSENCRYQLTYGDGSYSIGDLAADTFTFRSSNGRSPSFPKTAFGCGHEDVGNFNETASGIVGLGGGSLSIVNQFSSTIPRKFSYCLVPIDKSVSSKISFGVDSVGPGSKAVSTPLIKQIPDTFYFINLEGISVGNGAQKREITLRSSEGNIIIDSGTTLNLLPGELYNDLESTLASIIKAKPSPDPSGTFGLCYQADPNIRFPELVFHFTNADVVVPPANTFLEVSEGLICLAMVPSDDTAIFGNLSQMDFLIEYDLENEKLSFLPTDCTKVQ